MSINSIEVRIHLNYKFNLRLSNFIINSSILNTYTAFSVMQHVVKSSRMDVVEECFGGEIALRVRGLQARGITVSSFQRCQWKANIPQAVQPVMTFQDL